MPITTCKLNEQARGGFDGGRIKENKPIGFPHEVGKLKGYSKLMYWAHAYSDEGGVIAEHPHQVFDIVSFVLSGTLTHYDSKNDERAPLGAGGVQIIRAGNGITHQEELEPGTYFFQIWFDPDVRKTAEEEASYGNYAVDGFPTEEQEGVRTTYLMGEHSPVWSYTDDIEVRRSRFPSGEQKLNAGEDRILSVYVLDGKPELNGEKLEEHDFFKLEDEEELSFTSEAGTELFIVDVPKDPGYPTFLEQRFG
jgi:hypothetical protein